MSGLIVRRAIGGNVLAMLARKGGLCEIAGLLAVAAVLLSTPAHAQNSPVYAIENGTIAGADDLDRRLPSQKDVGPPRARRWVGLFYWQWHHRLRAWSSYNVTEWLKTHPGFRDWVANPSGGPGNPEWYWAEPIFGYYQSTDPWVIRRQLALINQAGVDFLFLDYTNGSIYDPELAQLLAVMRDMKRSGIRVPRLTFFLNYEPDWKVEALYKTWYAPGKYDDLWFRWQGKPLMMSGEPTDPSKFKDPSLLPAVRNAFTWRKTWALFDSTKAPTDWRFMDTHPQRPALGPDGRVEQMVVSKSMGGPIWDNPQRGSVSSTPGHIPVLNDQWLSADTPKGLFFEEQWRRAREVAAPVLLVTGWNEWVAAVWETPGVVMLGRRTGVGQGHIVDEFNEEFNRDIEPMRGGTGDNFYWQFVANMRRYKGMAPPERPSALRTIAIDGRFADWEGVRPLFTDGPGSTAQRDWDGTPKGTRYLNHSARCAFASAQVARDRSAVYFRVTAASRLPASAGRSWMNLFIDTDENRRSGWSGYDLLVNRDRTGSRCSVEQYVGPGWNWRRVGNARIASAGASVEIAVPRRLLRSARGRLSFQFKWADNLSDRPQPMDFYTEGAAAPVGRFNYRFSEPAALPARRSARK